MKMEELKKNWFWITCGLLAVTMAGIWYWQTSQLKASQISNEQMIDKNTKDAQAVMSKTAELDGQEGTPSAHPNPITEEGMKEEISASAEALIKAWEMRFQAQESIAQWPDEVKKNRDFVRTFKAIGLPESYRPDQLPNTNSLLNIYRTQVKNRMANLCERYRVDWQAGPKEKPQIQTNSSEKADPLKAIQKPVVNWEIDNQNLWNFKITDFKREGNKSDTPTAFQVFALQQDLWLLEAVFRVIEDVNGQADANDLASIKDIVHIVFGRDAQAKLGSIMDRDKSLISASVLGKAKAQSEAPSGPRSERDRNRDRANQVDKTVLKTTLYPPGSPSADLVLLTPFHNRYVDRDLNPIPISDLQAALTKQDLEAKNLESIVAKRVPFRLALRMDENKIPDLIAAFNSQSGGSLGGDINAEGSEPNQENASKISGFNFELLQVRINRQNDYGKLEENANSDSDGKRNRPAAGTGGGAGGATGLEGNGDSGAGAASGPVAAKNIELRKSFDVDVEFYGVVKIYNPVNYARLRGDSTNSEETPPAQTTSTDATTGSPKS
ncbi:MAG: hypothetical protein R3C03_02325 [Pirellulaceae bacterium]